MSKSMYKDKNNELMLIRGLPGSGNTTLALQYKREGYVHIESDMFMYENGKYHYDKEHSKVARACVRRLAHSLLCGGYNVVVSCTFVEYGVLEPFVNRARKLRKPPSD